MWYEASNNQLVWRNWEGDATCQIKRALNNNNSDSDI